MNKAELMQYIVKGGYRVHQGQTAPEPSTIDDTEQALIAGHGRRTTVHRQQKDKKRRLK